MTISNLGGIRGEAFTPIVNPPEVAKLGITRTNIRPVWIGETFTPTPMTPLDLSYDHCVINGANAAWFIKKTAHLSNNQTTCSLRQKSHGPTTRTNKFAFRSILKK